MAAAILTVTRENNETARPTGHGHAQARPSNHWKRDLLPASEAEEIISAIGPVSLFGLPKTATQNLQIWQTRAVKRG